MFPRAYEPVLQRLVDGLGERFGGKALRSVFTGVVRGLVREHVGEVKTGNPRRRLSDIVNKLGGSDAGIELHRKGDATLVRPCSCPLASVTAAHPELCALFAAAIGDVLGADVREECERGDSPRCGFRVTQRRP
jgi:predicted ArsR family transcriptional regulator